MSDFTFSRGDLERAADVVYRTLSPTPQYAWPLLGKELGADLWVDAGIKTDWEAETAAEAATHVVAGLESVPSGNKLKEIVAKIMSQSEGSILVVGHSNSIPDVIKMLGGDVSAVIDEKKFDDLFVVTVYGKGKAKVAHMKYGSAE